MNRIHGLVAAALLLGLTALPAAAQCPPFLCYLDLGPNPGFICPNGAVYDVFVPPASNPIVNPDCDAGQWHGAVVRVDLPEACSCLDVVVDYEGVPDGWTVNIGDSSTNNGFGGDAPGSIPAGQNAEVQVLEETLDLFSTETEPPLDNLAKHHLALTDGALHFKVADQFLSWGQPFTSISSPRERLFFLPSNPTPPDNRSIFVGINRTIGNANRNGCGARRVLMTVR